MHCNSKLIALLGVLPSSALAANVFSMFLDTNGAQIGTTTFDVGNDGCFAVERAAQVSFSQSGSADTATGPYCLTGFSEPACVGTATSQPFGNVQLGGGTTYMLEQGLNNVGSYSWEAAAC